MKHSKAFDIRVSRETSYRSYYSTICVRIRSKYIRKIKKYSHFAKKITLDLAKSSVIFIINLIMAFWLSGNNGEDILSA